MAPAPPGGAIGRQDCVLGRNFHQAFDNGLIPALLNTGLGLLTGGRAWGILNHLPSKNGHEHLTKLDSGSQSGRNGTIKYDQLKFENTILKLNVHLFTLL